MRKLLQITLALAVALAFSLSSAMGSREVPGVAVVAAQESFAPDHILVKFKPNLPAAAQATLHRLAGAAVLDALPAIDVQVVSVPAGQAQAIIAAYSRNPNVLLAEPDYVVSAIGAPAAPLALTPTDTYFGQQWGMTRIQAPTAWDSATGTGVKVAILDTGIDQTHEDLQGKIVANRNFTKSKTVDDRYGHGTHVAGIVAAATNNGKGVAGVGYYSSLMNGKVLDDNGSGYNSWIANGIIWATDNGAKVINMSLGGGGASSTMEAAVNYATSRGVVVVAAAGNENTTAASYPAYYPNVIAVAATDVTDARASFSNYGANWVDIAAPGKNIFSTMTDHRSTLTSRYGMPRNYASLSGTSMATPFVAGVAALVWSSPYGTSNTAVRARLEGKADAIAGTGTLWANGLLNASRAVSEP